MSDTHGNMVRTIWNTFWIMLIVTIVEVGAALVYYYNWRGQHRMILNIFFILASLAKAFYIVGVFMHLKFEKKYLAITILTPIIFLLFAVMTLLWEGSSWYDMRHMFITH